MATDTRVDQEPPASVNHQEASDEAAGPIDLDSLVSESVGAESGAHALALEAGWRDRGGGGADNAESGEPAAGAGREVEQAPYRIGPDECTYVLQQRKGVTIPYMVANFSAAISRVITRDDGSGASSRRWGITLRHTQGHERMVEINPDDYPKMSWTLAAGHEYRIVAGRGNADKMRDAVQFFSRGPVREEVVFTATGWREVDGENIYVHAGGAIGAQGTVEGVLADLPAELAQFVLPAPTRSRRELRQAIEASLGILDLAPDRITVPLLGQVYASIWGSVDHGVHLVGETGVFKSELAALAQQHYGARLDSRHLPGSWSSTPNALERLAYHAMDALLVVDDFAPRGSAHDVARLHATADRLFRGVGNRSGRSRLSRGSELRLATPPRCALLSSGEEVPNGHSCRARMLVVEVESGDVDLVQLTQLQSLAREGRLAMALARFILDTARTRDQTPNMRASYEAAIAEAIPRYAGGHARTGWICARLSVTLRILLDWALNVGAVDRPRHQQLLERVEAGLRAALAAQSRHQGEENPTHTFLEHLRALLASGQVHVRHREGEQVLGSPWGWRGDSAQGTHVGWLDPVDRQVLLLPTVVYTAVQRGAHLPVSVETLGRRLRQAGVLVGDPDPDHTTVRRAVAGRRHRVWIIDDRQVYPPAGGPSGPNGPLNP